MNRKCIVCPQNLNPKQVKRSGKFCSQKCHYKFNEGKPSPHFKNGLLRHKGYIYQLCKNHPRCDRDGYVLQHRLIMEYSLKRFLLPEEVVHHKNHVRDDNRIENLELKENQSEHMKTHYPKGHHIYKGEHPRGSSGKTWKVKR